jgi:hypothetical protein
MFAVGALIAQQKVHLHSFAAKQLDDAQSIVTVMLGAIAAVATSSQPDGPAFFEALDKMLAWSKPGAKHGEQFDFAKKPNQSSAR